ncbi:hypothetical protein KGF57_002403 [Candida theae]|uniref:Uncharacterized protein n=1 Tax=Candida theae TaxID=1198502 RepID=A0AAD5BEX6_9ASCO|nr:uncharacterized protein KGF57_002403 [Candida theae]KAI5958558.1 hypothetical protein KGF57_002403 [Candida theae]
MSANNAKKLMNILYKETAPKLQTSQAIPQISRQLYESESDLDSTDLFQFHSSTRRKLPAADALRLGNVSIPSNILSFKCPLSFITKHDFQNLLPSEHKLTYSLNPKYNFEVVKKRVGKLLQFQNEYLLIFKSHLNAKIYELETGGKWINGIQYATQYQHPIDVIDKLVPPKLQSANHQSLIDQIKSKATAQEALPSSTPVSSPLYDESFPLLSQLIDAPNRTKSIIVHNWPFGLKEDLAIESLWNYNLSTDDDGVPPIQYIHSNIMQGINIIKMNFRTEQDALRFIRNFHGTKWLKLQNFRKVEEKVSHLPLLCETL